MNNKPIVWNWIIHQFLDRASSLSRIFIFLFLFLLGSCKRPRKKITAKYRDGTTWVVFEYPDQRDTMNYVSKEYYHNGNIESISTIAGGKFVGKSLFFYPDGKIFQIERLLHPVDLSSADMDADVTNFYENGAISERFNVHNGYGHGDAKFYNQEGVLIKEYYVIKDSIKDGDYRDFFEDGKVQFRTTYRNDTLIGPNYYFRENGDTVKYIGVWKGQESMPYKKWLKNGNILEGDYTDSTGKVVLWKWVDPKGKEIKRWIQYPKNKMFICPEPNS